MKKGLVSVIMGIYNIPSKEMLQLAINSILEQTYKNIEFIIIDDGSTNDTYSWAKDIVNSDSRVILKRNKVNLGLTKTLNKCIKLCNGEYIARMDGDDISHLDRIEKEVIFLKENPEYDMVSTNVNLFDDTGIWGNRILPEIIKKEDFLFGSPIVHPTIIIKREALLKIGGYRVAWETNRTEDYDLFMRLYALGSKMYTIQEFLYDYREDEVCYSKRKYRYRITEMVVRLKGFKTLKLYPKAIPYVIKPLIVGLMPVNMIKKLRKIRENKEGK